MAPVRKEFLTNYPGPILVIDTAVPYEPLWWWTVQNVADARGMPLNREQSQDLTLKLRPRLSAERVTAMGIPCEPSLGTLSDLERAVVNEQVRLTEDDLKDFQRKGANNPLVRGYAMRDWADWWPLFFYRFVDPRSRMGERLNYAGRIRLGTAEILSSSWVIYRCPTPAPLPAGAGNSGVSGNARGNAP